MTRSNVDVDLHTGLGRLSSGSRCEAGEELIFLALDLIDLADRRRISGKRPLDGKRNQLSVRERGEFQRRRVGAV